jgi:hypothetical protein
LGNPTAASPERAQDPGCYRAQIVWNKPWSPLKNGEKKTWTHLHGVLFNTILLCKWMLTSNFADEWFQKGERTWEYIIAISSGFGLSLQITDPQIFIALLAVKVQPGRWTKYVGSDQTMRSPGVPYWQTPCVPVPGVMSPTLIPTLPNNPNISKVDYYVHN